MKILSCLFFTFAAQAFSSSIVTEKEQNIPTLSQSKRPSSSFSISEVESLIRAGLIMDHFSIESNRHFLSLYREISFKDHLRLLHRNIAIPFGPNSSFLHSYINFIFKHHKNSTFDSESRRLLVKILHKLIKFGFSVGVIEPVLKIVADWINFEEQTMSYKLAWSYYENFPIKETQLKVFQLFGLFSRYISAPLLSPQNRFNLLKETLNPSLEEVVLHFGPLMTLLFAEDLNGFSDDDIEDIHKRFFIESEQIFISNTFLVYLDVLIRVIPREALDCLDAFLKTFLNSRLGFSKRSNLPDEILFCCRNDLFMVLARLISINLNTFSLKTEELAYLFVQAARSKQQKVHFVLLSHFRVTLQQFDVSIFPILINCFVNPRIIANIRRMVKNLENK